ncbi:integral membrane protein [Phlyctema vagabunda]|uniref:Integral membrane protein n=1 Tax=Phlyctema vagabunda TaxID=108571 RepID=A0ABR4P9P5_9HELO
MTACIEDCTVLTGATTNGTLWIGGYDPEAPVPYWHRQMELVTLCITSSLTAVVLIARIWYRWARLRRLKADDKCMIIAGLFLLPYTACQIGTYIYGSGLHMVNVRDEWLEKHWRFTPGWAGYYIVTSFIKLSVCLCFIEILPHHLKGLRYSVYGLCTLIFSLGATMTFAWLFQCTPIESNFLWSVASSSCFNYDILRWLWIAISVPIDLVLLFIPWRLLQQLLLQEHERRILKLVFSATLLGTITCILGVYGVYENRTSAQLDAFYQETIFLMLNNIEITMYTLGASFPVLSRYLVARAAPSHNTLREQNSNFSSWAKRIPDMFRNMTTHPNISHPGSDTVHIRTTLGSVQHSISTTNDISAPSHSANMSDPTNERKDQEWVKPG